jgi:hypothetical protein
LAQQGKGGAWVAGVGFVGQGGNKFFDTFQRVVGIWHKMLPFVKGGDAEQCGQGFLISEGGAL